MKDLPGYQTAELLYENALAGANQIADFRLEGRATLSFPNGRM